MINKKKLVEYGSFIDLEYMKSTGCTYSKPTVNDDIVNTKHPYQIIIKNVLKIIKSSRMFGNIESIYLRGSLGKDMILNENTDIDWIFIISGPYNRKKLRELLYHCSKHYPFIRHDILYKDYHLVKDNLHTALNRPGSIARVMYDMKYNCKHLYGEDIRSKISDFTVDEIIHMNKVSTGYITHMVHDKYGPDLFMKLDPGHRKYPHTFRTLQEMMRVILYQEDLIDPKDITINTKKVIRQLFKDIVMERYMVHSNDLYYIHHFLVKYYPEMMDCWDEMIDMILNPEEYTNNLEIHSKVLHNYKKIIQFKEDYDKRIN